MIDEIELLNKYPEKRVFFSDKTNNSQWEAWKAWKDCSQKEKEIANLREIFPNELILDIEEDIDISQLKFMLSTDNINDYEIWKTGSRGIHIHIIFNDLEKHDIDIRNRIRKKLITKYGTDPAKASESTIIARLNYPHFKTNKEKNVIERIKGQENSVPKYVLDMIKDDIEKEKNFNNNFELKEEIFKEYHKKDPFFKYISENVISDDSARNLTIFPNIAIALVKEGLNDDEIKDLMKHIIEKNFPGKTYSEFYGWVKKARNQKINTYNIAQINNWADTYTKETKIYENKTMHNSLFKEKTTDNNTSPLIVYGDKDLKNLATEKTEWVIEDWVAKGDICFMAAKPSSYKTSLLINMCYCACTELPLFGLYKTTKSKVLYLNEENSKSGTKKTILAIKNGLDLKNQDINDFFFTVMQNLTLDNPEHVDNIIKFVKEKNIDVICFDSFRRFFDANENDATEINRICNNIKYIRNETGCTIILLHHLKKDTHGYASDSRDRLRGSGDIVALADSVISIDRKTGARNFLISHIKNRAGDEMTPKFIEVEGTNDKEHPENSYIKFVYKGESKQQSDGSTISKPEKCANEIVKFLEDKKMSIFKRESLSDINDRWAKDTVSKALRILIEEGSITEGSNGNKGRYSQYIFNQILDKDEKDISEFQEEL